MPKSLRARVEEHIENKELTFTELSVAIGYSKTTVSFWFNNKYTGDVELLERKISHYIGERFASLSFRDDRKLSAILAIIDESDDRAAIISAIVRNGVRE